MKITRLHIEEWRNFRDVLLEIPEETPLVCLVGENGTGKSNILELIGASANHLGLSPGIEQYRGNPFDQPHRFSITLNLGKRAEEVLGPGLQGGAEWASWDRTLTLTRSRDGKGRDQSTISAGGIDDAHRQGFVNKLLQELQQKKETQYLSLDADRSYPPVELQPHAYVDALKQDWDAMLRQQSFRPTRTMYDDWIRYFLARESQEATRHVQAIRRAKERGEAGPLFIDHFASYKESLKEVLPHLTFIGTDTQKMTLLFDTAGVELRFTHLSGGEREIAFLVGQIERFKLRRGLLLVDEPELHLNPDLVRAWVTYLRDTVEDGQVWIATHSLEAAEVAGRNATFVMERDTATRLVHKVISLRDRPVLAALAGALGSPAFSLSQLRFIFVEGERGTNERERFHKLCGEPDKNRFMEAGNGREVVRKLAAVQQLAAETDQQLRVGAILDRDYKNAKEVRDLKAMTGVFVLGCHEVENFFLQPEALAKLLTRSGENPDKATVLLCEAADRFAGAWILQAATADNSFRDMPEAMRQEAWQTHWLAIQNNIPAFATSLSGYYTAIDASLVPQLQSALVAASQQYEKTRTSGDLWKKCMGKQMMKAMSQSLGFKDVEVFEKNVLELWRANEVSLPNELVELRSFISGL